MGTAHEKDRVKKAKKKAPRTSKSPSPAAWPDREAASSLGITVREQLDYVAWISEAAEAVGFHTGESLTRWREAVQRAYDAFFDPMVQEHGDPLPPDVPPALQPGTWPDVPAARIQGMTIRHQLTFLRTASGLCRLHVGVHHQSAESERWSKRVQTACDAMDHGASHPIPDAARTRPPSAAPAKRTVPAAAGARSGGRPASEPTPKRRSPQPAVERATKKAPRRRR
jgi:hypothetical protein